MLAFSLLGFALLVISIDCQTSVIGQCDKPVQQNFKLEQYLGVWYEVQRSPFRRETGATCVAAQYTAIGNGSIEVVNSQITQNGKYSSITGNANLQDPSGNEAKLLVNFPSVGASNGTYWVMDTDYSNYSIVWSCNQNNQSTKVTSSQILWFLARERDPSEEVRRKVLDKMTDLGLLTTLKLSDTNQDECNLIV